MRVLLIEDDSATAKSVELMLKSESFNVYVTSLGEEGVDLGKIYDYDIILLDLNLPRKDGREALKEIKSHPDLRKIPVIVLTTSKADEDICKSYRLGVNSYITKPVTFASLVEVMKALGKYWFEIVELPSHD